MVHMSFFVAFLVATSVSVLVNGRPSELNSHSMRIRRPIKDIDESRGGKAICYGNWFERITTAVHANFTYQLPENDYQVTETLVSLTSAGNRFVEGLTNGEVQLPFDTYTTYTKTCLPNKIAKPKTILFLTHGAGFNRLYWDLAPGYSFVDAAAETGYATFAYDRLGAGLSSRSDPLKILQTPLELDIAFELVKQIRRGGFVDHTFEKVVAVGHSFGSIITEALAANHPEFIDAAILTGFSADMSPNPAFILGLHLSLARSRDWVRNYDLSYGYLATSDFTGFTTGFLKAPGFDMELARNTFDWDDDTFAIGELFSQKAVLKPAREFTGPVAIVNGDSDLAACSGNCSFPTNLATAALPKLFPKSKATASYLAKDAGHALNLHYSAASAYKFILNFLLKNGIAP